MKLDDEMDTDLVPICPIHRGELRNDRCVEGESWANVPDTARRILALGIRLRYKPLVHLVNGTPGHFGALLHELQGMADEEVCAALFKRFSQLIWRYFNRCSLAAAGHTVLPAIRVPRAKLTRVPKGMVLMDDGASEDFLNWSIQGNCRKLQDLLLGVGSASRLAYVAEVMNIPLLPISGHYNPVTVYADVIFRECTRMDTLDVVLHIMRGVDPALCAKYGF